MITAPYNFVPLNKEVFFPPWAQSVSHDIPFSDAQSGELSIRVTVKSLIFVRDSKEQEKFSNYKGTYYIPGSSLKGMVRNVLEIMSFSKMRFVDDDTYALRDLSKGKNFYLQQMQKDVFCGWLKKREDGKYIIEDCGIPGRIHHKQINKALSISFAENFKAGTFDAQKQTYKTAKYKYDLLGKLYNELHVKGPRKSTTNAKYDKREFYDFDATSAKKATLVVTGQPTPRKDNGKMGDGKGFEFLFFGKKAELEVSKAVFENFKFAYFDGRKTEPKESPDWTFWKQRLSDGEKVPVFFQKEQKKVLHFGLSYLYKLPYKHSIADGIPAVHKEAKRDLAETIFGYIDEKDALKSRVHFSHAKAINKAVELQERKEILGTPRASYYPIYIEQDGKTYKTYMDDGFLIAGYKRYPVHKGTNTTKTQATGNENVGTTFSPLKEGVVFEGKIRYHNLKKAELGALLSALTFHNTSGCFHTIGMAKSLGYGKVEVKVDGVAVDEYLRTFEATITQEIKEWIKTPQLRELFTMASEQNNQGNSVLRYMELKNFANAKTKQEYLKSYSRLDNIQTKTPKSFISKEDLEKIEQEYGLLQQQQKAQEQERKAQEEQERSENEKKAMYDKAKEGELSLKQSFVAKYKGTEEAKAIQQMIDQIETQQKEDKHKEVNAKAKSAYDALMKKKSNQKQFSKEKEKFLKKWEAKKNHKDSPYILELVAKLKEMK